MVDWLVRADAGRTVTWDLLEVDLVRGQLLDVVRSRLETMAAMCSVMQVMVVIVEIGWLGGREEGVEI